MKAQIKFLIVLLGSLYAVQAVEISPELQQSVQYISEQIEVALASRFLGMEENDAEDFKYLALLDIQPIHEYILTFAADFIPYFAQFYNELTKQLELNVIEEIYTFMEYQEILQQALLVTLNEAIDQHSQDQTLMQHVTHIAAMLNLQERLIPTAKRSRTIAPSVMSLPEVAYAVESSRNKSRVSRPRLRIQELLDKNEMNIDQLAQLTGRSKVFIKDLIKGKRGYSYSTLNRIAAALDVTVQELFIDPKDCPPLNPPNAILRIQEFLNREGWQCTQLARKIGCSYSSLHDIKVGKYRGSTDTLQKIAAEFRKDVLELFINPEDCPPELINAPNPYYKP